MSEQGKAREFLFYSDANELNYHQAIEHCHKLQKENEALKKELERCKEIAERDAKDYAALKAKLEKCKEALRFYSDYQEFKELPRHGEHARQTLKEIKDMK